MVSREKIKSAICHVTFDTKTRRNTRQINGFDVIRELCLVSDVYIIRAFVISRYNKLLSLNSTVLSICVSLFSASLLLENEGSNSRVIAIFFVS